MTFKLFLYSVVLLIAIFGYRNYALAAGALKVGDVAPSFSLNDASGQSHRLSDYAGKFLVLYFYPKDDTPGCTKEACQFRDDTTKFSALNTQVIGVSVDGGDSHTKFAKKYHLPFPLLVDADGAVAERYQALTNLVVMKIAKRHTFLIDPAGKIAKIYRNVDVSSHSQQLIEDIKQLQVKS